MLPPKLFGPFSNKLTDWSSEDNAGDVVKRLKPKVNSMPLDDKILSLGQLTLYIGVTAASTDQVYKFTLINSLNWSLYVLIVT